MKYIYVVIIVVSMVVLIGSVSWVKTQLTTSLNTAVQSSYTTRLEQIEKGCP